MTEIKPVGYIEEADIRVASMGIPRGTMIMPKGNWLRVPIYDRAALAAAWEAGREASAGAADGAWDAAVASDPESAKEIQRKLYGPSLIRQFRKFGSSTAKAIRALDNPHKGDA